MGLCLLPIRNVRRGAVFIGNTQRQLSAASEASSVVSSLFNISLKCYSSLSEEIGKQSGEVSESSDLPASHSLCRPKCALTTDDVACHTVQGGFCKRMMNERKPVSQTPWRHLRTTV